MINITTDITEKYLRFTTKKRIIDLQMKRIKHFKKAFFFSLLTTIRRKSTPIYIYFDNVELKIYNEIK